MTIYAYKNWKLTSTIFLLCIDLSLPEITRAETVSCSPNIIENSGSITVNFNCPISVSNQFVYSADEHVLTVIAKYYDMNSVAIKNFLKQINEENIPPYQVEKRLERLALEIKRLRAQANSIQASEDVKGFIVEAQNALGDGDIDRAVEYYRKALTKARHDEQNAVITLAFAAKIRLSTAELLNLKFKYVGALEVIKEGLANLPVSLVSLQAVMLTVYSESLYQSGVPNDEIKPQVAEAISLLEKTEQVQSPYYIRALAVSLRLAVTQKDLKTAKRIFYGKLKPIITSQEFKGSESALLCFSCIGKAFIDANDTKMAIEVLNDGINASRNKLIPDKVALAELFHNLAAAKQKSNELTAATELQETARKMALQAYPDGMHPDFIWIFIQAAQYSLDEDARIDNALMAMKIASRFLAVDDDRYNEALQHCLDIDQPIFILDSKTKTFSNVDTGDKLTSADVGFIGGGPRYTYLVERLFDLHYAKLISEVNEPKRISYGVNAFAQILYQNDQPTLALKYYKKTTEYMEGRGYNDELCMAYNNIVSFAADDGIGDLSNIPNMYKRTLDVCLHAVGSAHEYTIGARKAFIAHLVRTRRLKDAEQSLVEILASDPVFFSTNDGKKQITALRQILRTRSR